VALALALAIGWLLAPATGRAGLLPIHFQPGGPIVSGSNGRLTYNAATGDFNLMLSSPSLIFAAPFVQPNGFTTFSGSLSIDLLVDHSGHFVANGAGLQLTGTVTINGATFTGNAANPLLSGTITNFGSQAAGPPSLSFDGFFDITGGALTTTQPGSGGQPVFGGFPAGGSGGFILNAENVTSGTLGDFSSDFSSSSVKAHVGVPTPEPNSLVLSLTAAAVLGAWRLRRKRLLADAIG
jgi:hypothetical protein